MSVGVEGIKLQASSMAAPPFPVAPKPRKVLGLFQFQAEIVWLNAIGFLVGHLLALYGLGLVFKDLWRGQFGSFAWAFLLIFLSSEGITIGAHRLWCHRSYKATRPLQLLLIGLQTLAGQNCAYIWVRDHRQHHKYSDTDGDPHNARRGFFFSHIGWLMMRKHPEVISKGRTIDMSDLEANPIVMFQKKYYKSLYLLIGIILPIFVPYYLWNQSLWNSYFINFFTRYIVQLNITWCVNSWAHMFGTKPYDKNIVPVESVFVSFIGLGEGWHNYHHAFPWDYKASEFGMPLNGTTRLIEMFAKIGWAYDLREASHSLMTSRIKRCGDGSHPVYACADEEQQKTVLEEYRSNHLGNEYETEEQAIRGDSDTESCENLDTKNQDVRNNNLAPNKKFKLKNS